MAIGAVGGLLARGQDPAPAVPAERWNLFYQATSIGQYHGTFNSPYAGPFSLQDHPERDVSLTSTLFLGLDLRHNTQLYVDPEIAGGRGFSGVNGLANAPNGELPRVASATPKPYLARLYLLHDFAFGGETEHVDADENQLAGSRPVTRYTVVVAVSPSPISSTTTNTPTTPARSSWNGASCSTAPGITPPTRAATHGAGCTSSIPATGSLRYASVAEPRVANGSRFDRRLLRDRGDQYEVERRYLLLSRAGTVRLLHFENRTRSGSYGEALQVAAATGQKPDVAAIRKPGTLKYGFGINAEQELMQDFGVFLRLGWNDGRPKTSRSLPLIASQAAASP